MASIESFGQNVSNINNHEIMLKTEQVKVRAMQRAWWSERIQTQLNLQAKIGKFKVDEEHKLFLQLIRMNIQGLVST